MKMWDTWKQSFDVWENATAALLEQVLQNPLVLGPAGHTLAAVMRAKAKQDQRAATMWAAVGLPTRRDQERLLHAVNQLNSRVIDLEEQLASTKDELLAARDEPAVSPKRPAAKAKPAH